MALALRFSRSTPRTKPPRGRCLTHSGTGYRGGERWRIPSGRAAPRAELAGIRRQLGDRRQNRLSLLQGRAHPAFARGRFGHSRLERGRVRAGSPISGGYAGAKRTQLFIANSAQKESDRFGLGLHLMALAPRIMPDTALGKHAIDRYRRIADRLQSCAPSAYACSRPSGFRSRFRTPRGRIACFTFARKSRPFSQACSSGDVIEA